MSSWEDLYIQDHGFVHACRRVAFYPSKLITCLRDGTSGMTLALPPFMLLQGFPAHRLDAARDALAKAHTRLCRAAAKSGQEAPVAPTLAVVGEPYVVSKCRACGSLTLRGWVCEAPGCAAGGGTAIEVVDVEVTGTRPALAGWDFLACVEPLEGGNLIRQVPGASIAEGELTPWREGPIRCDHCSTSRRRTETFVVRADGSDPAILAGTYRQVGRNCLEMFLGGKSAASIVAMLGWPEIVRSAAGDEDEGGGWFGSAPKVHDPIVFLSWVCGVIREDGWLSRGATRDSGGKSTSDQALYLMEMPFGSIAEWSKERERCVPGDDGLSRATAALAWARDLSPTSDYETNLVLVARQSAVKPNHAGILASVVTAHTRAMGREIESRQRDEKNAARPSSYVGEVKVRIDLELTVERVVETVSDYGALNFLVMRDATNNLIVWKTGARSAKPGDQLKVRGTVKQHTEYRGEKQTVITRCEIFDEWPVKPPSKPRVKKVKSAASEQRDQERLEAARG